MRRWCFHGPDGLSATTGLAIALPPGNVGVFTFNTLLAAETLPFQSRACTVNA